MGVEWTDVHEEPLFVPRVCWTKILQFSTCNCPLHLSGSLRRQILTQIVKTAINCYFRTEVTRFSIAVLAVNRSILLMCHARARAEWKKSLDKATNSSDIAIFFNCHKMTRDSRVNIAQKFGQIFALYSVQTQHNEFGRTKKAQNNKFSSSKFWWTFC